MRNLQTIVLICMNSKVFDFVQWDGLVFGGGGIGGIVVLGIGAEGADVDFAGRDCAVGVDLEVSGRSSNIRLWGKRLEVNGEEESG